MAKYAFTFNNEIIFVGSLDAVRDRYLAWGLSAASYKIIEL